MRKRHGFSRTKLYKVWTGMKDRCYNPNSISRRFYMEKGIRVCEEWKDDFVSFRTWALENGYEEGKTLELDRIDPEKNYEPENCRWLPKKENISRANLGITRNTKKHMTVIKGKKKTIEEWGEVFGIDYYWIRRYLHMGYKDTRLVYQLAGDYPDNQNIKDFLTENNLRSYENEMEYRKKKIERWKKENFERGWS